VAIIDLEEPKSTVSTIEASNGTPFGFTGDITREKTVEAFAKEVLESYQRVDVLGNNAGIRLIRAAEETTAAEYRRVMDVNRVAPFLLVRAFGRKMLEARSGAIANVASIAGLVAVADRAVYNAPKHGLVGRTQTLAAGGGRGVRVSAVCPRRVKTELDVADQANGSYSDVHIMQRVPMGRFARPEGVTRAIAFLEDERESGFVNGATLTVDGGWSSDGSWESLRLRTR
jgi:NAD(P)-dependent dehydrogenase (short-subunit alcohol dehydrogenase family)